MTEIQLPQGQLIDLGTVAALNVAKTLGLPESSAEALKQGMADEIGMITRHFTHALADVRETFEKQVREMKSGYSWAREHALMIVAAYFAVLTAGFIFGKIF